MATDIERLIVSMEARTNAFEREMKRAQSQVASVTKRIEDDFAKANTNVKRQIDLMSSTAVGGFKNISAAAVSAFSIAEIGKMAEAWTNVGSAIQGAGVEASRAAGVQNDIAEIALRSRSGFAETASLYTRLTRASKDLGATQKEVAEVTETVGKALKLSGASASEANASILQLGQALGSGRLNGDELRSLSENAPVLIQASAKEFGVATGKVKELGEEGKLTADRVFKALRSAAGEINTAFSRVALTPTQAFTNLTTEATRFLGTSSLVQAGMSGLSASIQIVANNIDAFGTGAAALGTILLARYIAGGIVPATAATIAFLASLRPVPLAIDAITAAQARQQGAAGTGAAINALSAASQRATGSVTALGRALAFVGGGPGLAIIGIAAAVAYAASESAKG